MSTILNKSKCTSCPDDLRQTAPEFEWWHASTGTAACLGARHRGDYDETRDYGHAPAVPRHASPQVVDDSHRNDLPTGRVLLTCRGGALNGELVAASGYDERRHFGYTLTRHDDGMATVALLND